MSVGVMDIAFGLIYFSGATVIANVLLLLFRMCWIIKVSEFRAGVASVVLGSIFWITGYVIYFYLEDKIS